MSLPQIEAGLFRLKAEELAELDRRVAEIREALRAQGRRGTISEMARWSEERQRLPEEEADAFAEDVEDGRRWVNPPPPFNDWDEWE
jgi:hypothetical protein